MTAPIRSMDDLLNALRGRRDELNISHETIDAIAGLQSGYTSKLLAPRPIKNLGPMSFGSLLGALGLAVVVVEDPSQCQRVSKHWEPRKRPMKLPLSITLSTDNEVPAQIQITPEIKAQMEKSEFMKSIGKLGGKRRLKTMGKRRRQAIATHAARMRWSKQKQA